MANKPALVLPFHDTTGHIFDLFGLVIPTLKEYFSQVFISITPPTVETLKDRLDHITSNSFFTVNYNPQKSGVGDHHLSAYRNAVNFTPPDQILHLVEIDRLLYAINNHERDFFADVTNIPKTPYLFIRSAKAWETHPKKYSQAEKILTDLGELVFEKRVEFAWNHLVITTRDLKPVLPKDAGESFSVMAKIIIPLIPNLTTKEVDWLSWEDPFILEKDPETLKAERDNDLYDLRKRMEYTFPMIELFKDDFTSRFK